MKLNQPGASTVEEVYKDRDQFASLVREVAAPDVGRMGIEILSFTIKDVYDNVTYLQSLGKAQTAAVKRDAEIGVAQVNTTLPNEISNQNVINGTCCSSSKLGFVDHLKFVLLWVNL